MAFGIKWLKPELDESKYWIHILILAVLIYHTQPIILEYLSFLQGTIKIIVSYGLAIVLADTIAHTLLQLD